MSEWFKSGDRYVFHRDFVDEVAAEQFTPVVVIDPEDRAAAERLYHLYYENRGSEQPVGLLLDAMQKALREFADPKPPKPDEPTGLGAVVEDVAGCQWVRVERAALPWLGCVKGSLLNLRYDEIAAARVLSKGVQP